MMSIGDYNLSRTYIRRLERVRYEYGDLKPPLTTWTPEPIRPTMVNWWGST